jgi:hypothetical protein
VTARDFTASVPPNAGEQTSRTLERAPDTPNDTGSGVKVWVNTEWGVCHCPDSRWYGKTKQGEHMSESNAAKNGYHAAGVKYCESSQQCLSEFLVPIIRQ